VAAEAGAEIRKEHTRKKSIEKASATMRHAPILSPMIHLVSLYF
jgi:hypothetical protein